MDQFTKNVNSNYLFITIYNKCQAKSVKDEAKLLSLTDLAWHLLYSWYTKIKM